MITSYQDEHMLNNAQDSNELMVNNAQDSDELMVNNAQSVRDGLNTRRAMYAPSDNTEQIWASCLHLTYGLM